MTTMGNPGDSVPGDGFRQLVGDVRDLQRRMREISGQLVDAGLVGVDDGSGRALTLGQLGYGEQNLTTAALFSSAGNGVWRSDPLEAPVSVTVLTDRLKVDVSAVLFASIGVSNAVMSWTVTDAAGTLIANVDALRALVAPGGPSAAYASSSYRFTHVGLTPGVYKVRAFYMCQQWGATADTAFFQNRSVSVTPY